jgi:hypothetical protein
MFKQKGNKMSHRPSMFSKGKERKLTTDLAYLKKDRKEIK